MTHKITPTVFYRTVNVNGLEIFYREAGPRNAPTVLLLHGFPSSSHMFRNLIPVLADKYHVVAPDFPGYGESSAPSVNDFDYSFEGLAAVTEKFIEELNLSSYAVFLSDIGASVGFRLAVRVSDPSKISPDNWVIDRAYQDRPGNKEIQLSILYNAKRNLDVYADWQEYFRKP